MSYGANADRERSRTYAAADAAFVGTLMETWVGFQTLCDVSVLVVEHPWWQANAAWRTVELRLARKDSFRSSACLNVVRIARGAEELHTLVHELAHVAAPVAEAHGPVFRAMFIELAGLVCGPVAKENLTESFAADRLAVADVAACPSDGIGMHVVALAAGVAEVIVDVEPRSAAVRAPVDRFAATRTTSGAIAL